MKKLHQLISEKESELQNLEDSLGLGFPIVEQAKMTQISHLRLELEDLRQIEKSIQLNDNQKIVLEWLEEYYAKSQWPFPFYVLKHAANDMPANIFGFYDDFTMKEEFEVLAAFAQWGLEREEEE
ncbi:hypothetical protein EWH85_06570 [Enterococcus faecium]|uniref:hypothetical protein n=1 Tax=Enterococcus faecium TaxID=1352 RepID=UPI001020375F|nr:hypothetical protein [Enterococcus faecium]RYJ87527.1 hypothetical protein EWH85_06570 [Enterococcus faecium]